jgi:hypothetical protein
MSARAKSKPNNVKGCTMKTNTRESLAQQISACTNFNPEQALECANMVLGNIFVAEQRHEAARACAEPLPPQKVKPKALKGLACLNS